METINAHRPPCPFLPLCSENLDWRALNRHRQCRDAAFYRTALAYAQQLWQKGLSARALLAVDRALYADLNGGEPILAEWPLPYRVVPWMISHNPTGSFIGNPRVHYQHLADRVRGERAAQKCWRAWACWALVRAVAPELPPDPRHEVTEPTQQAIHEALGQHGIAGETETWQDALDGVLSRDA